MIREILKPSGKLNIVLRDKHGNIKEELNVDNLVVTTGLSYIAARMTDSGAPTDMSHMAVGSTSTAAALGNTALGQELGRVGLTTGQGVPNNNTIVYTATFPAGTGTGALAEAGILNFAIGGTLLCRTTFNTVNKGADDSVTITWTVTIS